MLRCILLVPVFSTLLVFPALAIDGVQEINQTCALQTGCFPGDSPGFPVTISASGSYRLTSNLEIDVGLIDATPDAISMGSTNGVSIDLNGFTIVCRRIVLPSGTAPCSNGSGVGINGNLNRTGTIVRNGSIDGFANNGVNGGTACLIEGVISRNNKLSGISVGNASLVRSNVTIDNLGAGIFGGFGALVEGNIAHGNGGDGIALALGSSGYRGNVVSGNSGTISGGTNLGGNACDGSIICP